MTNCKNDRVIPLERVVNAALLDARKTAGQSKELFFHFAGRGLRKLQREELKIGVRRVLLPVNHNTKTVTLPPDFEREVFVGVVINGRKVPMVRDTLLVNVGQVEEIDPEECCPKCKQDKAICDDLTVTESTDVVIVNGGSYDKVTIKKLYPNGDYYLEVNTPYYDTVTETVEYALIKKFITKIDLKDCGCPENTVENIEKIKSCNPDVYSCHYCPCDRSSSVRGGYLIFEETGLMQLDYNFNFDQVYVEFIGFMKKVNGQYVIPEVAFETLVEYVKYKDVQNKQNVSRGDKADYLESYRRERASMSKSMNLVSLNTILDAARSVPNFDINWGIGKTICESTSNPYVRKIVSSKVSASVCEANSISIGSNTSGTRHLTPFQLAVVAGSATNVGLPVEGETEYTNAALIGAVNLNTILLNETPLSRLAGHFDFDPAVGKITMFTGPWVAGDRLIASFAKLV